MAVIRKNGLFRDVTRFTLILGFLLAGWTSAFGYVGQSLQELQAQAEELTIPPDSILQEVKRKELPGTLFLMGFQDDLLVFFVLYEGSCVREWYVNLTLQKALTVLAKSGITHVGEQNSGHWHFGGENRGADYYPDEGNLSVFSFSHADKVTVYYHLSDEEKPKEARSPNNPK
jgi:hypothetical protein